MSRNYTAPPAVSDGDTVFANDVNDLNTASDTAFTLTEAELDNINSSLGTQVAKAEAWAKEAEDVEVEPGKFSSLHHATKSSQSATAASNSADSAAIVEASVLSSEINAANCAGSAFDSSEVTAADLVLTNTDVGLTNDNVVLTNADVVLTNSDVIKAEEWAENPEDVEVETGQFSSLHWSAKAKAEASAAASAAVDVVDSTVKVVNDCINGTFDTWQRGISQTVSGYGSDDRFTNLHGVSTKTHTRESFTKGQTIVPNNPHYYSRTIVATGSTTSSYVQKKHNVLDVTKYSGKKVAVSFYAKADSIKNIALGCHQDFGSGGSSTIFVNAETITLSSVWQKFTVFFNIPSILGKTIGALNHTRFQFWFDAGSTFDINTNYLGNQSGTFDIAEVEIYESDIERKTLRKNSVDTLDDCLTYCELITIYDDYTDTLSATVLRRTYSFNKKKLTSLPSATAVGDFQYWQGGIPTIFTPMLNSNETIFTLYGVGLTTARGFYSGIVLIEDEI